MVGYRGIAIFDKSIDRKITEKDVAKRLYKYADYPESFASEHKLGRSVERYPPTEEGNPNSKLDHFMIGGSYSGYLVGKKKPMGGRLRLESIPEDTIQMKKIPEEKLKDLWAHGLVDKYGVFTERDDYCAWDDERNKEICDRIKIRHWDDFHKTFLENLDPEDWLAVFHYNV